MNVIEERTNKLFCTEILNLLIFFLTRTKMLNLETLDLQELYKAQQMELQSMRKLI